MEYAAKIDPALGTDDYVRRASDLQETSTRHPALKFSGTSKLIVKPRHPVSPVAFNVHTLKQQDHKLLLLSHWTRLALMCAVSQERESRMQAHWLS
ncbi:hypothetical protein T265_08596 [Opisthorchis viverrini]|uniref:Uncharacterized protein n=1 Tax=Opisthorchis viverrini TaxID=6198 RepID=A0A075A7V8_OPIVI|nr:hypothetical protein T265_08596 [Opisthorchis viverrini]KER23554.1 hypothetical protein T265_08596 [Opisthorchis viverrini]